MSVTGDKIKDTPITITDIPEGESTYRIDVSYLTPEEDRITPQTLSTSFEIHFNREKAKEPDPITITSITSEAFPEGLASDYFTILAHDNYDVNDDNERDSFFKDDNIINKLNTYATNYLQNRTSYSAAAASSLSDTDKFYAEDENGIYILIDKDSLNEKTPASQIDTTKNPIVVVNSKECYKVYVKGTCELTGLTTNVTALRQMPNQIAAKDANDDGDKSLNIPNGYYLKFGDGTENNLYAYYMFIVNTIGLIYYGDEVKNANYDITKDTIISHGYSNNNTTWTPLYSHYNSIEAGGNYLFVGDYITTSSDIHEPSTDVSAEHKLFYEGSNPIIKTVIAADNITEINNFWHNSNASTMVINVENIGDYSFYGSGISTDILTSTSLKHIGKYAFANTPNLSLSSVDKQNEYKYNNISYFPLSSTIEEIDDYAFYESSGLSGVDLSGTYNSTTGANVILGNHVFDSCSNLRYVKYNEYQVSDIYLPPDQGSGGVYAPRSKGTQIVTASYGYDYDAATADPSAAAEKANSKYTFLNDSNITFDCIE